MLLVIIVSSACICEIMCVFVIKTGGKLYLYLNTRVCELCLEKIWVQKV